MNEKKVKFVIIVLLILLETFSILAFAQIKSASYEQSIVVPFIGKNISSPSYKTNVEIGIVNQIINSVSYINRVEFFQVFPFAETKGFSIDKTLIKALIKQGETYQTKFTVKNTGNAELSFDIDYSALQGIILLSDTKFALAPNEAKTVDVTVFASEDKKPDIYSGNIRIKGGSITKSLPVVIAVQAKVIMVKLSASYQPLGTKSDAR